jgi:hypothetical protein
VDLLLDLVERVIALCAKLGRAVLRPLGAQAALGAFYPMACLLVGLCIAVLVLAGLAFWLLG